MFYNEKEKLWGKEYKLLSWETGRKVNSLLSNLKTISPSSLPSREEKNRDSLLAGSGGNDRFSPSWQHDVDLSPLSLKTLMAVLPCFHSTADSKFSPPLQLSRAEFASLLLEAFSAFPCFWSLKLRNYTNFKSASLFFFFLPRNQQQILFFLQKNILTATHRVELSATIEHHFGSTTHFHQLFPSAKGLQIIQ